MVAIVMNRKERRIGQEDLRRQECQSRAGQLDNWGKMMEKEYEQRVRSATGLYSSRHSSELIGLWRNGVRVEEWGCEMGVGTEEEEVNQEALSRG